MSKGAAFIKESSTGYYLIVAGFALSPVLWVFTPYGNIRTRDLSKFTSADTQVVVSPPRPVSGSMVYPVSEARWRG
jgi:hypothetical protein